MPGRHPARILAALAALVLACALAGPAHGAGLPILPLADGLPPTDPAVSGGSLSWSAAPLVTVTASGSTDAGGSGLAGYEHRSSVNGGASWGPVVAGATLDVAAEGETVVQFRAVDGAGNTSAWSPATPDAGSTVRLDHTAPAGLTVSGGSLTWQAAPSVTVSVAGASDAESGVAGYEVRTSTDGGGTWSAGAPGASVVVAAEGETLVQFRALDAAGNASAWAPAPTAATATVRLDRTAPVAPSVTGGALAWQSVPSIAFSASGSSDAGGSGLAGYEVRASTTGGATWGASSSGASLTVPAEGETLVQFRAVDGAGNASAWAPAHAPSPTAQGTARIDRTAPAGTSVTGGATAWQSVASVTVSASGASDPGAGLAGYEHRTSTDGGATWGSAAAGASVDVTAEGETLVQFRASDAAGNTSAWTPASPTIGGTVRLDRSAPGVPLATGGSSAWQSVNGITITGSGSDAGGAGIAAWQTRTSTDGGAGWATPIVGASLDVVDEGETLVQFRSVDAAGNASAWGPAAGTAAATARIDRTGPGNPVVSGGSLAWQSVAGVTVSGSGAVDAGGSALAGYQWRASADGGGTWTAAASGPSTTVAAQGETIVQFRALDGAGNPSAWVPVAATSGSTVRIDRTAPVGVAVAGGSLSWLSVPSVSFTASGATDAGGAGLSGYEGRTSTDGGASWSAPASGASLTVSAEGETLVQFRAGDAAGNRSSWSPAHAPTPTAAATARIDRTPPGVPSGLAGPSPTASPPAITWTAVPGASSYRVLRDGVQVGTPAGASFTDALASAGSRVYRVIAVDLAANASAPSAPLTIVYSPGGDTTPPDTRLTRLPATLGRNASPTVAFADDGTGIGFDCQVDASSWAACVSPLALGPLPDGTHTVRVRARDAAGNVDPTPAQAVFAIDTTPPATPAAPSGSGLPLEVSWPGITDAVSYEVGRGGPPYLATTGTVIGWDGTDRIGPVAPGGLVATDGGRGAVRISWDATQDQGEDVVLVIRALDAAGNASAWSEPGTAHARAGVARYRVYLDGAVRTETEDTAVRLDGLVPGSAHRVHVVAVDRVGNASAASAPVEVMAGTAGAPSAGPSSTTMTLRVPTATVYARPGVPVRLAVAARGVVGPVRWRIDGADVTGASVIHRFTTGGRRIVTVTATGMDGRTTRAVVAVVVDGTPPALVARRAGARLRIAARDAGAGVARVQVSVAGGGWRSAWHHATVLPSGRSVVRVRAVDRAGNVRALRLRVTVSP